MRLHARWNRREFVTVLGLAGAATALPAVGERVGLQTPGVEERPAVRPYAIHLSHLGHRQSGRHGVEHFAVEGERWASLGRGVTDTLFLPEALAVHPTLPLMYVAHGRYVEEKTGRPCGAVSAYAMASGAQAMREMGRQPLALSSTTPKDLAISPDGRWLLVAASGGGAYNLLPLAGDGSLCVVEHVLKMTGGGPWRNSAYPNAVLFHPSGVAYGADWAADRVDVLSLSEAPVVMAQHQFPVGSGPAEMALSPDADKLFVATRWTPGVAMLPVNEETGAVTGEPQWQRMDGFCGGPVTATPSRVYVAAAEDPSMPEAMAGRAGSPTLIHVFEYERLRSGLRLLEQVRLPEMTEAKRLIVHEEELLVVGRGGVLAMAVDGHGGRLGPARYVVQRGDFTDAVVQSL